MGVWGFKLVTFWDLLCLRVDNLAITLDFAIFLVYVWGGGGGWGRGDR